MYLRLNRNGTTIDLNTAPWYVEDGYVPMTPESKGQDTEDVDSSGGERYVQVWRNITESVSLYYSGTQANFITALQALNRMFLDASDRQNNHMLPRVYLEFKVNVGDPWYRSEILQAKLDLGPKTLSYPSSGFGAKLTVAFHRRYYWEQSNETEIPLRSFATAKQTGGVRINTHWDAEEQNWVELLAADVAGDMKAPIRLKVLNYNRPSWWFSRMWMAHNVYADPANLDIQLEGESTAVGGDSYTGSMGTDQGGNNKTLYSMGYYRGFTNLNGTNQVLTWTLDSTKMTRLGGNYFHCLARMASSVSLTAQMRLELKLSLTTIAATGWVFGQTGQMQDFGSMQIPPATAPSGSFLDLTLALQYKAGSANEGFNLDFLLLMPTESYVKINQLGYSGVPNDYLVVDEVEKQLYAVDGVTGKYWTIFTREGLPLQITPNKLQRMYFTQIDPYGNFYPGDQLTVSMYYHPRRLHL